MPEDRQLHVLYLPVRAAADLMDKQGQCWKEKFYHASALISELLKWILVQLYLYKQPLPRIRAFKMVETSLGLKLVNDTRWMLKHDEPKGKPLSLNSQLNQNKPSLNIGKNPKI